MNRYAIRLISCLFLFTAGMGIAQAQTPTRASVDKLLAVTETRKLMEQNQGQVEVMMRRAFEQNMANSPDPAAAKAVADKVIAKLAGQVRNELSWEKMEGFYVQLYTETFTQPEIDGLIRFYESEAGHAFTRKMPIVMQKSMMMTQERLAPLMQQLKTAIQEAVNEQRRAQQQQGKPAPSR
ncbi:DUF2059 domain-containing protein [Azoarcus indigens]|uniref:DUF2059 domain-containing protein n=1 Tax=Azoarcus indigens TaxID=29545 RepID=A0A4R6DWJ8_9RHOO|nr:DUF2059 domain-containing protein [Azoarcus indigens]NMG65148.1 DUF2059 domain-containing protein [Azoarcus indigens]TDN49593.1 hypothetical protein C7389_11172 [Azoarcus indigens]